MRISLIRCRRRWLDRGFTLLELLVVLAITAVATGGVSLALRDNADTALERESQRLVVLFESARALSRASGVPVYWRPTDSGFVFEGVPPKALPAGWLAPGTAARTLKRIQLGPEPIIGPQSVDLISVVSPEGQPQRSLRLTTDGIRPFAVQANQAGQP